LGAIYFGGGRDDVHVLSTSAAADEVRPKVMRMDGAKTARVDTRVDTLVPFERLAGMLEDAGSIYGSKTAYWHGYDGKGEARKMTGRTVYLGAPSSAIRVRLYEKWLESPGQYVEGTNRVEVQLRPASKVKAKVSEWTPAETFCASKVTRELAKMLGDDLAPKKSLHVKKDTPDLERTLRVMGEQYGPSFRRYLALGDLDTALGYLLDPKDED
jgi:hypothetical protein